MFQIPSIDWVAIGVLVTILIPAIAFGVRHIWRMSASNKEHEILNTAIDNETETRKREDDRLEKMMKAMQVDISKKASKTDFIDLKKSFSQELQLLNARTWQILQIVSGQRNGGSTQTGKKE